MNEFKTYKEVNSLLGEFLQGFSFLDDKDLYLKHPTNLDISYSDQKYVEYYNQSINRGVLNNKQRLDLLVQEKLWEEEKDKKIENLKSELNNLKQTKNKLFLSKQIKEISDKIRDLEKEYNNLRLEKEELLGETAETYAIKKSNEYFVLSLFYKDENFKECVINKKNIEEIFLEDTEELFIYYNIISRKFNKNIKKIAALPSLINAIFLFEDGVIDFFGKEVLKLTIYQSEVLSKLKNYKNILVKTNNFPTEDLYEDFDKLVFWYESAGSSISVENKENKSNTKQKENMGGSYIGATKEELEKLAKNKGEITVDLGKEAAKKGGELSFSDILKLHQ